MLSVASVASAGGATPVAVIRNGQAYMIHTDHLDTPRFTLRRTRHAA